MKNARNKLLAISLTLLVINFCTAFCAETNIEPADAGQVNGSTNTHPRLKGFMKKTLVVSTPDQQTIAQVKSIESKLKVSSGPKAGKVGPQNLGEAAEFLARNVSMAHPPGACLEHKGIFFFSGGRSTKIETNFVSGFAIKKGETVIYTWEEDDLKPEKQ